MSSPNGDDPDVSQDVISSLPRSRRQRPTARREAARARRADATAKAAGKRAPKATAAAKTAKAPAAKAATGAAKPAARKPKTTAANGVGSTSARKRVRPPRRAIPPAGYATPTSRRDRGTADPGAALGRLAGAGASALRGVLKRLPL
jgi:hypothetical protein